MGVFVADGSDTFFCGWPGAFLRVIWCISYVVVFGDSFCEWCMDTFSMGILYFLGVDCGGFFGGHLDIFVMIFCTCWAFFCGCFLGHY